MQRTAAQVLFLKLEQEHPNLFNVHTVEGREFINNYHHILEIEKQQKQQTIEEVFDWLTKNNYVTDLKETLIEQYKKQ
jgi:spore coat polysaccharide biosynthesis protein SpsF (cytidylyltransferase family)